MNVPYKFQKVRVFLAQNRLVSVLEKMPVPIVAAVEGDSISCQKSPHDSGY